MKKYYSELDVEQEARRLTDEFGEACSVYKLALSSRDSNRAKKELMRDNIRGTSIYKFQYSFCWAIHNLTNGPRCFAQRHIDDLEELISHIHKISNN